MLSINVDESVFIYINRERHKAMLLNQIEIRESESGNDDKRR